MRQAKHAFRRSTIGRARRTWPRTWDAWGSGNGRILAILLILAALGLAADGWQAAYRWWQEQRRPSAVYRRALRSGLAISLNALERERDQTPRLPGMRLQGVLVDRSRNDWILFGEAAPERPGLPLDALAVAFRALQAHLEDPGIDIRPQGGQESGRHRPQQVHYFGGVEDTVVGGWFFQFDYWMKRLSLGEEPSPLPEILVYWQRAVEALDREVATCRMTGPARRVRRNRYWLCASDFTGIEDECTLVFDRTPLRVLAESVKNWDELAAARASPGVSRGTDDPLAAEFAQRLSAHLSQLTPVVPVSQIEDFSKLLAGLSWVLTVDPYRDTSPWLQGELARTDTSTSVPTLARQATRRHTVRGASSLVAHEHSLEISGGVTVSPRLTCARAGDESLRLLYRAVLAARPAGEPAMWQFSYQPPSV